jgi:UDPglucose 6-dehydrogenase
MAGALPGAVLYDKYKKIGSLEGINSCDVIFICVPTPYSKKTGCDISAVQEVFSNIMGKKIIVIKSTVLPGTTVNMQKKYPQHKVLFNPEFLRAESAKKDALFPDRQIIGYTEKSRGVAKSILKILPHAPFVKILPASEAEMVKYFGNTFLASKVIFANQIYDLCKKNGINYDLVKECAAADKRIGSSHLDVFHKGYRGYGEHCFPKDVGAFINWACKKKVDASFLKVVQKINKDLTKQ